MSQTVTVLNTTATPTTPSVPEPSSPPQTPHAQAAGSRRQQDAPRRSARGRWKRYLACYYMFRDKYPAKARLAAIGLLLGLISLLVAIVSLAPSFGGFKYGNLSAKYAQESIALDAWQANATFRAWCQDEEDAARTLSMACEDILRHPLPPPPPHLKRSFARRLMDNTHLLWHGGRKLANRSARYLRVLGRVAITTLLALFFWKYNKRLFMKMIKAIIRVGREHDLLPLFLRREHGNTTYSPIITLTRASPPPPRSSAITSAHQENTQPTNFSFSFRSPQPSVSGLRSRIIPSHFKQPLVRKPLPPVMQDYLRKFYGSEFTHDVNQVHHQMVDPEPDSENDPFYHRHSGQQAKPETAREVKTNLQNDKVYYPTYDEKREIAEAASTGNIVRLEFFVGKGIPINAECRYGWNALHTAAAHGQQKAVEYLLSSNADIDGRDVLGKTALHWAIMRNFPHVRDFLIQRGANIYIIDKFGKPPGAYAALPHHQRLFKEAYICGGDKRENHKLHFL